MDPFYKEFVNRMETLHAAAAEAVQGLDVADLDWSPTPDVPSLNILVMHMSGAERFWVGDVALGDPSNRDRPAEFRVQGLTSAGLLARLAQSTAYITLAAERLSGSDLSELCLSPRDGQKFTRAWALLHALEHTGIHLGHMQIVRSLLKTRS